VGAGDSGAADAGLTMVAVNTAIRRMIGTTRFQRYTMIQLSCDGIGGYDPMNDDARRDKMPPRCHQR
jgi:hypothetical protein